MDEIDLRSFPPVVTVTTDLAPDLITKEQFFHGYEVRSGEGGGGLVTSLTAQDGSSLVGSGVMTVVMWIRGVDGSVDINGLYTKDEQG